MLEGMENFEASEMLKRQKRLVCGKRSLPVTRRSDHRDDNAFSCFATSTVLFSTIDLFLEVRPKHPSFEMRQVDMGCIMTTSSGRPRRNARTR